MYEIRILKSAVKELAKLPKKEALKVTSRLNKLRKDPRPKGCVKLKSSKNEYRIRSGNYRILYTIEDDILIVYVIKIGNRKDVYKK